MGRPRHGRGVFRASVIGGELIADPFETLAAALDVGPVTKPASQSQPQRMNANAFCIRNCVFAMRVGPDLVLKLPPRRVAELIAAGQAAPNVVGERPMKEWANLPPGTEDTWLSLARESLGYVRDKR
jgi:hypothetical protein